MQFFIFFFNDTATTEIYTLSLHDALPIWSLVAREGCLRVPDLAALVHPVELDVEGYDLLVEDAAFHGLDRKSTRLNSSHANISYAVFCLKKKKKSNNTPTKKSSSDNVAHD